MLIFKRFGTAATVLLVAACGNMPASRISLEWIPRDTLGAVSDIGTTSLQFETFADVREQPALVGVNRERSTPRNAATQDDVGKFVSSNMRHSLQDAGFKTVDTDGDVVLSGTVHQFFVTETSTYQGVVSLQIALRDRGGKILWQGTTAGSAEHFGHSYSAENYNETLSDAVLNATSALLRDPEFHRAITSAQIAEPIPGLNN